MQSNQAPEQQIRQQGRAVLVVNMLSRGAAFSDPGPQHLLELNGFTFSAVFYCNQREDLPMAVEQALAARPALLIVGSGDGTVSQIAGRMAYRDTVLGFLPFGTTNNFARSLGIPPGLDAAVDVIVNGKVADVDLGRAGSRYFANVAGIGLSADVAASVSPWLKRRLGRTAYLLAGIRKLLRHHAFAADIEARGKPCAYSPIRS